MDRRVLRTRRRLQEALLSLIMEKGYDRVTVQDILNRADVGRSTFYSHYLNKADLLLGNMREDEFRLSPTDESIDIPSVAWLFQHASEHVDLYRALRSTEVMPIIYRNMRDGLQRNFEGLLPRMEAAGRITSVPGHATSAFLSHALLGLLVWWLDNLMPHSPEEMDSLFRSLTEHGLKFSKATAKAT